MVFMINFFVLILMSIFLVACDNTSLDVDLDNYYSSSHEELYISSSSGDTLEYVAPPKLSGREYNPDFNAIINRLAPPLYSDGKWVMARFETIKTEMGEYEVPKYDNFFEFFVSKDDMATWEKSAFSLSGHFDNIKSAFVWNNRFYYVYRDVFNEERIFFFSSEDGFSWDSIPVVGLPAEHKESIVQEADFHVANNKVFATGVGHCYMTSDLETWQEMKLRDGGPACGNNVAWGEPGYRMSGSNGVIFYSDDGVVWDSTSTNGTLNGYKIAYGNGVYVRGTYNGSDALQWSRDGIEWNPVKYVNSNYSSIFYEGVVFEGGIFLAYGGGMMSGSRSFLLVSANGQDWVEQDKVAYRDILRIVYGNGRYVATIYGENFFALFQKEP